MTVEETGTVADSGEESTPEATQDETIEAQGEESDPVDYAGTMHMIKVNGEDTEVPYEDMVKSTQLDKASYKRMEDASKLVKQIQPVLEIIKAAKAGDTSVLRKLGISKQALRKFSEEELLAAIEEDEWTDDQRRAHTAEEKNKTLEAESKRNQEREFKQYQQYHETKAADRIQDELQVAFKELGIPLKGNSRLVARTCEDRLQNPANTSMVESLKRSLKALDDEFSEHARREYEKNPDSFLERLPENIPDGLRKRMLKEVGSQLPIGRNDELKKPRKGVTKPDDDFTSYMREEMQRRG